MAWSKRTNKPVNHSPQVAPAESKVEAHYTEPKTAESAYPLDGGYNYKGPGHSEEYVDSEDHKTVKEQDEAQQNSELDDTDKSDEHDEHSEKGGHKEFKAGGFSFDKHLKDHKADNKEVENIKQHDIGQKFGGESTKEHKLGKHKEKSKGHKLHGFKNVYHKEEYGDHKTFHDEFLDTDHQHNYDDHHEHQEVDGGKFSKAFKQEGKNNKFDKGDEKHEWGKEDFDVHSEGHHDKGGNKSKHRHATKKHQGHFDANSQRQKNSVHKIKKGAPPSYVHHGGHHGPHQAQIEPYVPHYNSHHEQINVPPHNSNPPIDTHSHQPQYDVESHSSNEGYGNHHHSSADHHGSHQNTHGGHNDNGHNDENYDTNGGQDNYHERTAHNHQHRGLGKEKNNDKLIPHAKEEQVIRKYDPIEQKHETNIQSHEPASFKAQPVVNIKEPATQKHEPYKHQPQTHNHQSHVHNHEPHAHNYQSHVHNHQPHAHNHQSHAHNHQPHAHNHLSRMHNHQSHAHNHQSHAHKNTFSPNHGIQHYRKPVYPDNSQLRSSQFAKNEKFSEPLTDKFNTHNHRIRYGFQPRNREHDNHNRRFHFNSQNHHQRQPFPRYSGFNHQHLSASHGHHHQPHGSHYHSSNKNHNHFRHTPSNYQQANGSDVHGAKYEQAPITSSKSEDQHIVSQKRLD